MVERCKNRENNCIFAPKSTLFTATMDIKQYALSTAQRTQAAISSGDIEEAIRLSGEATATLDAEWTRLYNAGENGCDAALIAGNFVACRHIDALMQGGAVDEAFPTAMLLLYRSTLARSSSAELAQSQLDILCLSLSSALHIGEAQGFTSPEADDDVIDHFAHIVSYIASMLFAFYNEVGNSRPDTPMLEDAYQLLEQMQAIGAIQQPCISIADSDIAANDIPAVLPDLLGRCKALGILKTD